MTHVAFNDAKKEFYSLVDRLDVGTPGFEIVQHNLTIMRSAAMRLSNIGERECNGVIGPDGFAKWDDADQKHADNVRANAEKRVSDSLAALFDAETLARLELEFQGDPRGPSVIIGIKDGPQRIVTLW